MLAVDHDRFKALVGQYVTYQGRIYAVIEILEDGPALVLQACDERRVIQANQHGEANRCVTQTLTVTLLNGRGDGYNPLLPELAQLLA